MKTLFTKYVSEPTVMDIYWIVDADGDEISYWSTKEEAEKALEDGCKIICEKTDVRPINNV